MSDEGANRPAASGKAVTIYDVAFRANVSIKTVSKVVNDLRDVSKETRARVLAAIDELGYRPNQLARSLAKQRSFMLALFCDAPAAGSQYIARIQMAILTMCQKEGYHLNVECIHASNLKIDSQVRALVTQSKLEAVVLTPPLTDLPDLIETLKGTHTPIIRFSPRTADPQAIDVAIDNTQAAFDVTQYLLSLGHRRIGFVRGPAEHADAEQRFSGYRKAISEAGITYEVELCPMGTYAYNSGVECGVELLGLKRRPTAIFAANDDMAAGVMAASMRYHLEIPRDLSVVGFDDAVISHGVSPRLTTCRQPIEDMAEKSFLALIARGGPKTGQIILPHKIVVRGSTAAPASRDVDTSAQS